MWRGSSSTLRKPVGFQERHFAAPRRPPMTRSSTEGIGAEGLTSGGALVSNARPELAASGKGMPTYVLCLLYDTGPFFLLVTLPSSGEEQSSAPWNGGWHGQRTAPSPCVCVCVCVWADGHSWSPGVAMDKGTNHATCGDVSDSGDAALLFNRRNWCGRYSSIKRCILKNSCRDWLTISCRVRHKRDKW
ncbi:hypothetical protein LZ30DRAFT_297781 [Colletotrichum cereale]|nr:hypothetical protein LZ30DRAFT_297781 [Colletotrichum cereale]